MLKIVAGKLGKFASPLILIGIVLNVLKGQSRADKKWRC